MQRLLSLFCILVCCWLISADLTLEVLDTAVANQAGARCLDGSPGSYHFEQGAETKKWVIYMHGGGSCDTKADCASRAKSDLGSSNYQRQTIKLDNVASDDPIGNPGFWNWTHVQLDYCSGDRWAGTRVNASVDTWGFYFAGHVIFQALINQLISKYHLDQATDILFHGTSAGALGVITNVDVLNQMLPGPRISISIDSGWGVDFHPAWNGTGVDGEVNESISLYHAYVNQACAAANPTNLTSCSFPRYSFPYIPNRVFILNSLIDPIQLYTLGFPDEDIYAPNGSNYLIALGNYTKLSILTEYTRDPKVDGLFITSCPHHGIGFAIQGVLPNVAVANWYYRPKNSSTPAVNYDNCALDSVVSILQAHPSIDCPTLIQQCTKNTSPNIFEAAFSSALVESDAPSASVDNMPMDDSTTSNANVSTYLCVITIILLVAGLI